MTIEGVLTRPLVWHRDLRGRLMEILRRDDPEFTDFGQVYLTVTHPGVVKAWHMHLKQTDTFCCVSGRLKLAMYDGREGSATRGGVMELELAGREPILVSIPPGIYHGWKCVSGTEALVINVPNMPYDRERPDEYRLPPDHPDIPYRWDLTPGLVHG